jgi:hypothetical protein
MTRQVIGVGTIANDGTGDPLRTAWTKANSNFTELYTTLYDLGTAQGQIIYRGASGWAVLAPGTSGFVLQTNGAGASPSWVAGGGGGGGGGSSTIPVTTVSSSGTSQSIAFPASGSAAYDVTLTGNCVFTITGGTAGQEQTIRVFARGGTGGFTPSWPAGVKWAGGTAPAASIPASGIAAYTFRTPDAGTTIVGEF